jgi:cell division protein FtsQ
VTLARRALEHRLLTVAAVVATAVGAWAGWMWLRDVSLLRVKHVEIEGVQGREARAIERALRQTAQRMTTLHVREDELEQAVDSFPVVRSVSASADFPTTLKIKVDAHDPVAVLSSDNGRHVAVSASGIMLEGIGAGAHLPEVKVTALSDSREMPDGAGRTLVGVLGQAPKELRRYLVRAYANRDGVRVAVREGPVLEFGRPVRIAAKWAAVARVLADPGSTGAEVIDVRLPERPAARGQSEEEQESSTPSTSSDTAVAGAAAAAVQSTAAGAATGATAVGVTGADATGQSGVTGPAETYTQP